MRKATRMREATLLKLCRWLVICCAGLHAAIAWSGGAVRVVHVTRRLHESCAHAKRGRRHVRDDHHGPLAAKCTQDTSTRSSNRMDRRAALLFFLVCPWTISAPPASAAVIKAPDSDIAFTSTGEAVCCVP